MTASWTPNSDLLDRLESSSSTDPAPINSSPRRGRGGDVLSRDPFLPQLYREKRRADRSRAPLSLVVMRFDDQARFDEDDRREIMTNLSLSMRETDAIGCLGDGVVAFLLPYTEAKDAEAFSRLFVRRTNTPATSVRFAAYPDSEFDTLLVDSLAQSEAGSLSTPSPLAPNNSPVAAPTPSMVYGWTTRTAGAWCAPPTRHRRW